VAVLPGTSRDDDFTRGGWWAYHAWWRWLLRSGYICHQGILVFSFRYYLVRNLFKKERSGEKPLTGERFCVLVFQVTG
jgi:hypothetical protein